MGHTPFEGELEEQRVSLETPADGGRLVGTEEISELSKRVKQLVCGKIGQS